MSLEYRLTVQREGRPKKVRLYRTRTALERRLVLLGPEPWTAFGAKADDHRCCDGKDGDGFPCGCGGETERQYSEKMRMGMPKLVSLVVEEREITRGRWHPREEKEATK